jgi:molybdenum cofactor cytidylyltransferase
MTPQPMRVFGLIPAAGKSLRMGRPKLALPLGKQSVLERVIATVRGAGVDVVLVVIGPHVPELVPLAEAANAQILLLSEETPDMRATITHGLRWLEERYQPTSDESWLLLPADHPTVDGEVVRQLLTARQADPASTLLVPTFQGHRGHPVLLGWKHVAAIRALPEGLGVNAYVRQHAAQTREVPVASPSILWDLDTPEDYARLCAEGDASR